MKRFIKLFVIIIVMLSLCGQVMFVFANESKKAYSQFGDNLLEYIQGYDDNLLLYRKNYGYMILVEKFQSDWVSLYLLEMSDIFAKTGSEPNKEKYMEVLLNIIATYDLDNASTISEQYSLDNIKGFKDYALDFMEMGKEAISVVIGNSPTASQFETSIATAINGLSVLAGNTDNWINAISDLETIVQNYEKYDGFLKLIEEKGEGELKEAAVTLRKGMSEALEIKLSTYAEISIENFKEYSEFFFSDIFFEILKQTPQYNSDENIKFFVDCGDNIVTKVSTLQSSWNLGVMIGKLVGNVAVGGENVINRLLEMMALHDISVIIQEEIIDLSSEFIEKYGTSEEETIIKNYVLYSQYLIGCRIRGEYCMYSTVANDAGLLSWFNKESAEQAKEWYDNKVNRIMNIQDNLLNIYNVSENIEIQEQTVDYAEIYDHIIDQYSECKSKEYVDLEKENINPMVIVEGMDQLYYTLYDLNGDNVLELIIAEGSEKLIIDIRTICDNEIVRVFDDQYRLGIKNSCTIGENNYIYLFTPNGAFKAYEYIYKLSKDNINCVTLFECYEMNAEEGAIRYFDITNGSRREISEEEYDNEVINNYNNGSRFKWESIVKY